LPDTLIDRVRAADPVRPGEFDGLADFAALNLAPRRRRRRLLAGLPAVAAAALAAVILLPASAPQAKEVVRRAVDAMALDQGGILYAQTSVRASTGADYGTRRVWVRGDDARLLQVSGTGDATAGSQEVTHDGSITRYAPDGRKTTSMEGSMVPGEIFRSAALLDAARAGRQVDLEETTLAGRPAYALHWEEPSGPPHHPKIEMTLWVDRETYVPLQFTDHSSGLDVSGKPFDESLTETVDAFERLPDTPENRRLLDAGAPRG
jgi:hypothetical protein